MPVIRYAQFFSDLARLGEVNWNAVEATDFRDPIINEGKQAEFLVYKSFPWELVETIGVIDASVKSQVQAAISGAIHKPVVSVKRVWYY